MTIWKAGSLEITVNNKSYFIHMLNNKVNVAIQLLPKVNPDEVYPQVDKAIAIIKESGVTYKVCPFETVMEGDYDEIMKIVKTIQETCLNNGAEETLVYLKIQAGNNKDILISDKTGNYE